MLFHLAQRAVSAINRAVDARWPALRQPRQAGAVLARVRPTTRALGAAYGVNLIRVLPGGQSSARHAHSKQDEFVYVIEGEFVLVTDAGRETVGPGTCIGFPAGTVR